MCYININSKVSRKLISVIASAALLFPMTPSFAAADTVNHDCTNECKHNSSMDPYTSGRTSTSASDGKSKADTDAYIQADDSKIVASVPTELHIRVEGDGSLITPSDATVKNGSIFGVHVSNIKATSKDGFNLLKKDNDGNAAGKAGDYTGNTNDAIFFLISSGGSGETVLGDCTEDAGQDTSKGDWNLGKKCSQDENECNQSCGLENSNCTDGQCDSLPIQSNGAIYNVTKDLGKEHKFATITWTFKGGHQATGSSI